MTSIPKDSLVLVTGANGFIASHIADAFLAAGYRVRGTARSASKLGGLKAFWDDKYGPRRFEIFVVEDMGKEGAFDEAVKGVAGVAHVASIMPDQADPASVAKPELVIDAVVNATLFLLRSAAAQPSVKAFVLTSSSSAAVWPKTDVVYDIGEDTWNTESTEKAYNLPASDPMKPFWIYAASKTLGEQAAWKWYKEEKPGFYFNTILPNMNIGPTLGTENPRSSSSWLISLFNGDISLFHILPAQYYIDVRDTAALHMLALTSPKLASGGARIWAVAGPLNGNDILQMLRELYPEKSFPEDVEGMGRDLSRIDNKRATELLGHWRDLKEAVRANTEKL